jgi:hypothetical protein
MCKLIGTAQDMCVLDTYCCMIEQAEPGFAERAERRSSWSLLRKYHKTGPMAF